MPKVHLYVGPPLSGKTEALVLKMKGLPPFDYLFIGSKGEFVKNVARLATRKMGIVNRDAFKTIDQVAVEAVLRQKDFLFADHTLKLSILSQIIEDMASRNVDLPYPELSRQASMIKRRSTVEKLLSLIDDVKTYMKEEEFRDPQDRRDVFISYVIEKFKNYFRSKGLFDTYDAYKMVADGKVNISGKYLFVDGFYDFTPIVSVFFKGIIPTFDHVFASVTTGEIFESGTKSILKTFDEFQTDIEEMSFKGGELARGLFASQGKGLRLYRFEKMRDEVKWVCGKVKSAVLKGEKISNVEIVVKSFESPYVKALREKFEEYGLKASYLAKKKLSQSVAVQQLMLPLRTITNGYPPDLLASMVTVGYAGKEENFNLVYDLAKLYRGPLRLSRERRLENWVQRLNNYIEYLSRKMDLMKNDYETYNVSSSLEEIRKTMRLVKRAQDTVSRLFDFLGRFEKAKSVSDYTRVYKEAIDVVKKRSLTDDDKNAVETFEKMLWHVEGVWNFLGKESLSLSEYRFYLELQIGDEFYTPCEDENTVRISDVLTSRFTYKPLKIFVGFREGIYPSFHQNYFYTSLEEEKHFGQDRFMKNLRDERIDLYTSLTKSEEAYLTFPTSNEDGTVLLPSLYSMELKEKFRVKDETPSDFPPMSLQEAILAYSRWARKNGRKNEIEERLGISLGKKRAYTLRPSKELKDLSNAPVSFSRLDKYEKCPLDFFFSYVLKLPEEFSYVFGLTTQEIGIVYHNVLKNVLRVYTRSELKNKIEGLYGVLKEFVREELAKTSFLEGPLFEIETVRLTTVLFNYMRKVELRDLEDLNERKREFKYLFYKSSDHEFEPYVPYKFEYPIEGEDGVVDGIRFTGRIDRIDLCSKGLMIVDYKSKNAGSKKQLCIYSAVAEKIFKKPVLQAAFAKIEKGEVSLHFKDIREELPEVLEEIREFLKNVEKGSFAPTKKGCMMCNYSILCPEAR